MAVEFRCAKNERWLMIQNHASITGIDYLEVDGSQQEISLYFIPKAPGHGALPPGIAKENIRILKGSQDSGIRVTQVIPDIPGNRLVIRVDDGRGIAGRTGDFSRYTLRLVNVPDIDPVYSSIAFSFKVNCTSTLDCRISSACPGEPAAPLKIDYLSKDYASFRQLMLDRLSLVLPDWNERSPADLMVALVEILAYAADHLSYYQDAVATEAYLGTARKRVSVRRHARLLDYPMHDGCNARVWVSVWLDGYDGKILPGPSKPEEYPLHGGTMFLTRTGVYPDNSIVTEDKLPEALNRGALVFETMHDITLFAKHREIRFYTWGNSDCCLPRGALAATLGNTLTGENYPDLRAGDVLILEETCTPEDSDGKSGFGPPNPARRHAVRLTKALSATGIDGDPLTDPLTGQKITGIAWAPEDALPFPLCISRNGTVISVARGNIVLADHGRTVREDSIGPVPENGAFSPVLKNRPVTQQGHVLKRIRNNDELLPFDPGSPASPVVSRNFRYVLPSVRLHDRDGPVRESWNPARDLLASDPFALDFVLDTGEDGTPAIRFGNDITGRRPASGHRFEAVYRIGNGTAGNIGHDTIAHIVLPEDPNNPASVALRNPLPASGGTDPEPIEQVRRDAPQAIRTQERAVTVADYAGVAGRHPEVQKALASRRWTGSWHTIFIAVDRRGGKEVDDAFREEILQYLEKYRLAGHDLEIVPPVFVPLDIKLNVCVLPEYIGSDIEGRLKDLFSNRTLPDGTRGFFHPDNFTFGQSVYLSAIVAFAMQVPGIRWIDAPVLKRWGQPATEALLAEKIEISPHEIARLDNDPGNTRNGQIVFSMAGGL